MSGFQNISDTKSPAVRRRKVGKKEQKVMVVAEAAPRDEWRKALRLVALVLVSVAALAATAHVLVDEWNHTHLSSAEDCGEMKEMDHAVRNLGLDGLPGYVESCFTLEERLRTAAEPFTGPVADLLQEGTDRLHRLVRHLNNLVTFVPRVTYKALMDFIDWQVEMVVITFHQKPADVEGEGRLGDEVPAEELDDDEVPAEELDDDEQEELEEIEQIEEDIDKELDKDGEEAVPPSGVSTDEGDTDVPEEHEAARRSEDSKDSQEADVALVLTQEDLRILVKRMAALFGREVDEGSLDALVHSLGSRRSSSGAARAGEE